MQSWAAILLALLLLAIAGCIEAAIVPEGGHEPWTRTESEAWFAMTRGCGFCSGDPHLAEVATLVLFENGEVLWFSYGTGQLGDEDRVTGEDPVEPWLDQIEATTAELETGYLNDRHIHVHQVATSRLRGDDWTDIEYRLLKLEGDLQDPGEPRYDCEDCAGPTLEVLGEGHLMARLWHSEVDEEQYGNYRPGDDWDRLLAQLVAVQDWVVAWKQPQGPE